MSTASWIIMAAYMVAGLCSTACGASPLSEAKEAAKNTGPWDAVDALWNDGDLDLACTRCQRLLEDDYTMENAAKLLKFCKDVSASMEPKITRDGPILFEKPSVWSFSRNEDAKAMKIALPDTKEVNKNMAIFDAQKAALQTLLAKVTESRLSNPNDWNKKMKAEAETELRRVANIRRRYVSYMVVSPYLYETHRKAFIARGFFDDSESGLRNAGKVMAKGLSLAWLYQCTDSVKDQYVEVIEYLKANCEEKLWDSILTQTSVIKAIDKTGIKDETATKNNEWLHLP